MLLLVVIHDLLERQLHWRYLIADNKRGPRPRNCKFHTQLTPVNTAVSAPRDACIRPWRPRHADDVNEYRNVGALGRHLKEGLIAFLRMQIFAEEILSGIFIT
jgi:hypothetical protein